MVDLRAIEAGLIRDVEHTVLANLGYAEYDLWLPGEVDPLVPRPQVQQLDPQASYRVAQALVNDPQSSREGRHDVIWKAVIPRTVEWDRVNAYGLWQLRHQSMSDRVACVLINLTPQDAVWTAYLGNHNGGLL